MKIRTTAVLAAAIVGILAVAASAAEGEKPKIAIYVMSAELSESEMKSVENRILAQFIRSGRYTMVDRSDASLGELEREMIKQMGGSVDDKQISRLGIQAGVKFLCIVGLTNAFGKYELTARMLDTETAVIVGLGLVKLNSHDEIEWAAGEIYKQVTDTKKTGRTQPPTERSGAPASAKQGDTRQKGAQQKSTPPKNARLGIRGGANMYDYSDKHTYNSYYRTGNGYAAGPALKIRLMDQASVYSEAAFQYRKLYSFSYYHYDNDYTNKENVTEMLVSVPLMAQYAPLYSIPFYVAAGAQMEIPIYTKRDINYMDDRPAYSRNATNYGIALELGYMVTPSFAVDLRGVIGVTPLFTAAYGGGGYGSLMQFGAGLTLFL